MMMQVVDPERAIIAAGIIIIAGIMIFIIRNKKVIQNRVKEQGEYE